MAEHREWIDWHLVDHLAVCLSMVMKNLREKEEQMMRYVVVMLLALGIGLAATAPAAFADGGGVCYKKGVALSCTQPAPVYLGTGSSSGAVAP